MLTAEVTALSLEAAVLYDVDDEDRQQYNEGKQAERDDEGAPPFPQQTPKQIHGCCVVLVHQ